MFMQHRVTLHDGAEIAYHDLGSGPPVLLIHGFVGTARTHMGLLIDDLSRDHRVIAPDLRGYGASRPPNRTFPPDFYQRDAADMAELLDLIQPGPVVVMGFSDGGESALILAASRPDVLRGVVAWGVSGVMSQAMVNAVQDWLPATAWVERRPSWRQEIIELHGSEQFEAIIEGWVHAAQAIAAAGGDICFQTASRIRCPVLLINGDGERNNLPSDVQRLAAAIPNCRLEFVTNSGHAIQEDQPEALIRLIRQFLAQLAL